MKPKYCLKFHQNVSSDTLWSTSYPVVMFYGHLKVPYGADFAFKILFVKQQVFMYHYITAYNQLQILESNS